MREITVRDWFVPRSKFKKHFRYPCRFPPDGKIASEKELNEFCELIDKCIEDNFDYTIEKYGTIPSLFKGPPEIIWD